MITWDDFAEVADWVAESWPKSPWSNEEANTIYQRMMGGVIIDDLWSAIHLAFNAGGMYPPGIAELVKATKDQAALRLSKTPVLEPEVTAPVSRYLQSSGFADWDAAVRHFADEYKQQRLNHPDPTIRSRWVQRYGVTE